MGFIKEVYSENRAGLVVAFNRDVNSNNYFNGDSIEAAMEYFNMYLEGNELMIRTEDKIALDTMGLQNEDASAIRSALDTMLTSVSDEEVESVMVLFPQWKVNTTYIVNQRVRYGNNIYKVLQDHTSQADWTPDVAPSLFSALLVNEETGEILEWTQPDSTNPYMIGDRVLFEGKVYESVIDNNSWSPADYAAGWKEIIE